MRTPFTSRVTPGWSSTMASRLPTSRLNSADLPTLGLPTIATLRKLIPHFHTIAVGPVACLHAPLARRLHLQQFDGVLAGRDDDTLLHGEHLARLPGPRSEERRVGKEGSPAW